MPEKREHIKKILIANRGEIALRVQRTARRMGIATVAVYSNADREAAFVKQADTSVLLEGNQLGETYLNIEKIIAIARQTGADAIHPGYGFLSESPGFAEACEKAGVIFIGPNAAAMKAMGNKIAARETAVKAGVPVIPGITGSVSALLSNYQSTGFPLLVKAAAGGGGKGMRTVHNEAEFQTALEATAREAQNYFGDSTVYIEKYIAHPRHIEVQILGDQYGNIIHLYERECSLQRRHQKIIEEAPSPALDPVTRQRICSAAVQLAKSIGYYSAGTMEFLADEYLNFYFLEMNTRIQVEHPVTELTTGIDIVEQQIKIAADEALQYKQEDIHQQGHAIECRIYAEDPAQGFLPSPGLIKYYEEPAFNQQATIRIDGMQLQNGDTISGDFDPMISKLVVSAATRDEAREAMLAALQRYHIKGIKTNIEFLTGLMQLPDYIHNNISTKYIDDHLDKINSYIEQKRAEADITVPLAAALIKSFDNTHIQQKNIW
ncbi:MAG: biotin carboxylase N-terminal domain-containing protein, partial [Niabella sp.]